MKQGKSMLCLLLAVLLLLCGCGSGAATSQADSSAQSDTSATDGMDETEKSNGEAEDTQESEFVGGFGIGSDTSLVDEEGNAVAIEYTGGELAVEYHADGYGIGKDFGILLFVDGVPQPFHTDTDSEVAYMHYFSIKEDHGTIHFTLYFTPVTGQAGDTLTLTVCAVNNAQYQPDMIETISYFNYQGSIESCPSLYIAETPETVDWADTVEAMTNVSVSTSPLTEEFVDSQQYEADYLERYMCCLIYYDGHEKYDNLDLTGQETVHITIQVYGGPAGGAYCVTCYANHHVLTDGESVTQKITVGEDEVVSLEFDLEVSQLEDMTTFYAYICPVSAYDDQLGIKTRSILLYQTD